jgi:hypothetical protein
MERTYTLWGSTLSQGLTDRGQEFDKDGQGHTLRMTVEGYWRVAHSRRTWAVSPGLLSVGAAWLKISGHASTGGH